MNYELIGAITGLICVYLCVKQSIWNWPVGIVSVLAFFMLFMDIRLYADAMLQLFYVATGLYGWYLWKYGGENRTNLKVTTLTWKSRAWLLAALIPASYGIGWFLFHNTNASLPYLDSLVATMSVFAQLLMMKKIYENWFLWITVDILSIGMYINKEVYLTAGLYGVFLVLATMGALEWRKGLK